MIVIPPLAITDARLTSSTVVETAPTAYAGGTTYALSDTASVAGALGLITTYRSLQAGNTGHAPASSPTWWVNIGDTYQAYSGAATYALGETVIDPTAHIVYESLIAGNIGQSLADATKWLQIGTTNKWLMFDLNTNARTVVPTSLTIVVSPGRRVDAFDISGMVNVDTLTISATHNSLPVYSYSVDLTAREVNDWYDYFFAPFSFAQSSVRFDLPPYSDNVITLTLSTATGNVEVGQFIVGSQVYVGKTQYNAVRDYNNFSTIIRDFAGDLALLTQRMGVPKTRQNVLIEKQHAQQIADLLITLDATIASWSGLDDDSDGWFEPMHIIGFVRSGPIDISYPEHAMLTLELESI